MMRTKIIQLTSGLFIFLFVYAALTKLMEYEKFLVQLSQSPMLTDTADVLAWLVPCLELSISAGMIFETSRVFALHASVSLMTMFTGYIILASQFSDYVPCSCGGIIESLSWNGHLILNIALILAGICAILMHALPAVKNAS